MRIFDTHPHARFYVFDPGRTEGKTYFIPYVNDFDSPNTPGFLLQIVKSGVFTAYFDGILKLWTRAEKFSDYLQNPAVDH